MLHVHNITFPSSLQGLNVVDLEDLLEDIKVYCELEKDTHLDYWKVGT